jgi:hypothetical protein
MLSRWFAFVVDPSLRVFASYGERTLSQDIKFIPDDRGRKFIRNIGNTDHFHMV